MSAYYDSVSGRGMGISGKGVRTGAENLVAKAIAGSRLKVVIVGASQGNSLSKFPLLLHSSRLMLAAYFSPCLPSPGVTKDYECNCIWMYKIPYYY